MDKLSNVKFVINDDGLKRFYELSIHFWTNMHHAKKKCARGNQMPFFTKERAKEIMTRSRLRNKYLKTEMKKVEPYM